MTVAARPAPATGGRTPVEPELRRLRLAMVAATASVWVGLYALYVRVWIQPNEVRGNLEAWARPVADGTAAAPFQYRFLVPDLLVWWSDSWGWPVGFGLQVVDALALALGAATLHVVLGRLDLRVWSLPAALYGSFLGLGLLWWGKFETITSFAALTLGLAALTDTTERRTTAYLISAVLLVGTRTDLLVALGLAELARWWWGRRASSARCPWPGLALAATGVIATFALRSLWPDAAYDPGTGVVQIAHNLQPTVALTAVVFLVPALAPYALCWRGPHLRDRLRPHLALLVPLGVLVGVEVASVAAIGRVEEVRLFFPLTGALAVLGAIGWRAAWQLCGEAGPAADASAQAV
jgi:hypothetical protein